MILGRLTLPDCVCLFADRLGVLGWTPFRLNQSSVSDGSVAANGTTVVANQGFLDQREALRWVQREIHHFGGDSSRVMLFGESAGAISVLNHLITPASHGLFSSVISESGYPVAGPLDSSEYVRNTVGARAPHHHCPDAGGGGSGQEEQLGCMQSWNLSTLLTAQGCLDPEQPLKVFSSGLVWGFTIDTVEITDQPLALFRQNDGALVAPNVSIILGSNHNEGTLFTNVRCSRFYKRTTHCDVSITSSSYQCASLAFRCRRRSSRQDFRKKLS